MRQAGSPGRLKRRAQFLAAASKGRKAAMPGLILQCLPRADDEPARLGFTVTKKVGNAVVRNRTKRRLREAARLLLGAEPVSGADLVLIGRDSTRGRRFDLLIDDLRRALAKAGAFAAQQPASAAANSTSVRQMDAVAAAQCAAQPAGGVAASKPVSVGMPSAGMPSAGMQSVGAPSAGMQSVGTP